MEHLAQITHFSAAFTIRAVVTEQLTLTTHLLAAFILRAVVTEYTMYLARNKNLSAAFNTSGSNQVVDIQHIFIGCLHDNKSGSDGVVKFQSKRIGCFHYKSDSQ